MSFDFVNPRQAIVATTRGEVEIMGKTVHKDNAFTLTWHCPLSHEPFLYGISVSPDRFSYKLIKKSKVFVINFLSHQYRDDVLLVGTQSGLAQDKFQKTKFSKKDANTLDCCRIKEADAWLECEVVDEVEVGDHVFFIGKVIHKEVKDDNKRII